LECLESVKKNDYPNKQVVIIDNNSDKKIKTDFKVIYNQENLGFAGGNNVGIKYALEQGADYVLLLNNDTVAGPDFLSKLVKAGESDKSFGMLGPKIYFYFDKNRIWSAGGQVNWLYNKGIMKGYGEIDKGQYDHQEETEYLTGCCLLIKKEVINKIGLMPEEYFLYYEDTDWSLKAQQAGFKCIFAPSAKIWHKGSVSSKKGSSSYIYYHVRNGLRMAQKYAPWYIQPLIHLDAVWRIKKQILKIIFSPKRRFWAKAILLGIKDFYFKKLGKYENWH
jgi:GT2 family glycosyltransferase